MMKFNCIIITILSLIFNCFNTYGQKQLLPSSKDYWLGSLMNKHAASINFNFQIIDSLNKQFIYIYNANEKLVVDEIKAKADSVHIVMPFFDSEFMLKAYQDSLVGYYKKNYDKYSTYIPFKAIKEKRRFPEVKAIVDKQFNGTWATYFISANKTDTSFAIGEFNENNGKIFGTFLSSTGDYRFLEGVSDGKKIYLSSFDGSHVYRFEAEISENKKELINGKFYSGLTSLSSFYSIYQPDAKLPAADELTFLKNPDTKFEFSFKNIEGKNISLNDERYKNKIVLVQIMGSWCPNCMDEAYFLKDYYKKISRNELEIIGLCYERSSDFNIASNNAKKMKNRIGIEYELLIAGTNARGNVNESLPMLKNFIAFPTLIILDKNHKVRKIHTGYSGPATGKHYVEYKYEFEKFINSLLKE